MKQVKPFGGGTDSLKEQIMSDPELAWNYIQEHEEYLSRMWRVLAEIKYLQERSKARDFDLDAHLEMIRIALVSLEELDR